MYTIRLSKDMNGLFWVKNGDVSTASLHHEGAKAIAEKMVKDAGGDEYAAIEDGTGKLAECTIRRRARKDGYYIRKSRKINIAPDDQGEYMLIDLGTGFPAFGYSYDATLDEIAKFLADEAGAA